MQKDLIDVHLFSDRFSKHSENFEINTDLLVAEEKNGELIFPITFSDKFLVTVRTNEKTSLLTSVSIVYAYEKKDTITDKDFLLLKELIEASVKAFTDYEKTEDIFIKLSLNKKENIASDMHMHYEKDFYKFSLVSNDVGIYFSASTDRR